MCNIFVHECISRHSVKQVNNVWKLKELRNNNNTYLNYSLYQYKYAQEPFIMSFLLVIFVNARGRPIFEQHYENKQILLKRLSSFVLFIAYTCFLLLQCRSNVLALAPRCFVETIYLLFVIEDRLWYLIK